MTVKSATSIKSAATRITKRELLWLLLELELFLSEFVPELHNELCTKNFGRTVIKDLCKILSKPLCNYHIFSVVAYDFLTKVRTCTQQRATMIGAKDTESRIKISDWPERKSLLSRDTTKEELLIIALGLINEAASHLGDYSIEMSHTNTLRIFRRIKKRTKKHDTSPVIIT